VVVVQHPPKAAQPQQISIVPSSDSFSHSEACEIADVALSSRALGRRTVVIVDLKNAVEATTSAFARLVLLRRLLLKTGRDLRLINLRDRAMSLYQINRLGGVLPCM
jgi:MFS superfamily sulfate permease-like transporter